MNISTFPANKPFLSLLSHRLFTESLNNPVSASSTLVLLPTNRACRRLQAMLEEKAGTHPLILPRILAFDAMEEDALLQAELLAFAGEAFRRQPVKINAMKRRFKLAKLCMAVDLDHGQPSLQFHQALELADALATLLDELQREQVDISKLDTLAPADYAEHWQSILKFLHIITEYWPRILEEENEQDPRSYGNFYLETLADAWRKNPPSYRVLVAGSTASNLATAKLMAVVASLPHGEVILPALNPAMEQEIWESVAETHPAFFLKQFLTLVNKEHTSVALWDTPEVAKSCSPERISTLAMSMLPASEVHRWVDFLVSPDALAQVEFITHDSYAQEAETIALICRHAFAEGAKSICIVCEDAGLKAELKLALEAYHINADASEGVTLGESPWAQFMRLMVAAAEEPENPVNMLALLKHPYTHLSFARHELLSAVHFLEIHVFRADQSFHHLPQICKYLEQSQDERASITIELLKRYNVCIESFNKCLNRAAPLFTDLWSAHIAAAELLARGADGRCVIWSYPANHDVQVFIDTLTLHAHHIGSIDPSGYAQSLVQLMAKEEYRVQRDAVHQVRILPSAEARLETADVMIAAGMNEGSWPKSIQANPWMSRPMQAALGLQLPEVNSSRMAHDLVMLAHAPRLIFSRATKDQGAETLESRWLQRLRASCHALPSDSYGRVFNNDTYAKWLQHIKKADTSVQAVSRPTPTPPAASRPTSFSVTALERLQRDPYAIYAERILCLKPLASLSEESTNKVFGSMAHYMLQIWCEEFLQKNIVVDEPVMEYLTNKSLEKFAIDAPQQYLWKPKLLAIIAWAELTHHARAEQITTVAAEQPLHIALQGAMHEYSIKGVADRIELRRDGSMVVVDYKTGTPPKNKDIREFIACQLPLECLMLMKMDAYKHRHIAGYEHWKISSMDGKSKVIGIDKKIELESFLVNLEAHIISLLDMYMCEETPFTAVPDDALIPAYHTYAQLERYAEWC